MNTTIPTATLEAAKSDFQMAIDHWASGENFVCYAETTQTIMALLDAAMASSRGNSTGEITTTDETVPPHETISMSDAMYEVGPKETP